MRANSIFRSMHQPENAGWLVLAIVAANRFWHSTLHHDLF
jgi:hypothetical protein